MIKPLLNTRFYRQKDGKVVTYLHPYALLLISVLLAVLFTYAQQSASLQALLVNKRFWVACTWSFIPAWLLMNYIQLITRHLDKTWCWRSETQQRLKRQFFCGMAIPALFLAIFYTSYFAAYGKSVIKRKYFQQEFPMAIFAITCLNTGYAFWYLLKMGKVQDKKHELELRNERREKRILSAKNKLFVEKIKVLKQHRTNKQNSFAKKISISSNGKEVLVLVETIICAMRWDAIGIILLSTGDAHILDNTLEQLREWLDFRVFAKTNRWCVVNLKYIAYTINEGENENAKKICYHQDIQRLLHKLEAEESNLLKRNGAIGRLSDKYLLNRSFRENVEKRLKNLYETSI